MKGIENIEYLVIEYSDKIVKKRWKGKIIDREKWQKDLLESLKFTDIHRGEKVIKVEKGKVITDKGRYRADYVVGAEGPLSVVRRSFKLKTSPVLPAINVRLPLRKRIENTYIFFLPEIEKGYGWLFPRGEYANVGIGSSTKLKERVDFFVDFLYKRGLVSKESVVSSVGFIPLYEFIPVVNVKTFLIGDAAGLTDPLTGAGIYQSYDSARMLAKVLKGERELKDYVKEMGKTYGRFLTRRHEKRILFEKKWKDLEKAVEESWISTFRG